LGRILNKREVAEIFGVSPQAVDGWLGRGCPYLEKGAPGVGYQFDTADVAEWRQEQAVTKAIGDSKPDDQENAELRKLSAEASLAELKLARERGQLVTVEDAGKVWTKQVTTLRTRLLAIPAKLAGQVVGAKSPEEVRACLDEEINDALNELADGGTDDESLDGDVGAVSGTAEGDVSGPAAAKVNAQRMGGSKGEGPVGHVPARKVPGRKRGVPARDAGCAD
jgi:phage terminase Nu1 subunit (DNA packaging protein)